MPKMTDVGQKVDNRGFKIASGIFLAIALILAIGRTTIKVSKFHKLFVDDVIFIAAAVLLLAGTIMTFLTLPYNQTEVNVGAGIEAPPADFMHQLDFDVKFQDAAALLLNASIYSVKFSFLFFFRLLLGRTGRLQAWWWFVFIFTIPCAGVCMCTEFIVCPAFGDRILEVCASNSALKRQTAALYSVVALDIASDILLITIPVLMLWKVEINIRRKFGLGWVLCLSIFAIITNIIRASGHKLNNGQNDVVWILFWGEMEACVAVIANSMTAFRSLFIGRISQAGGSPQDKEPPTERRVRQRKRVPHVTLPTMPSATFSGLRSLMHADPFEDKETMESELTLDDSCVDEKRSLDTGSHRNAQSTPRDWHERNISLHETSV